MLHGPTKPIEKPSKRKGWIVILQDLTPFDLRSAVLILMLGTVLAGCKPAVEQAQNGKSPETPKLSAEEQRSREQQLKAFRECQAMSLASVKKAGMEYAVQYSQNLNDLNLSTDQLAKVKPTIPFTYNYAYDRGFDLTPRKHYHTERGVTYPDPKNSEYQHAWVGPYHLKFLPYDSELPALSSGNSEFNFGTYATFGFHLSEVFSLLGIPELTKDIVYYQNQFTHGKWLTNDVVKIAVVCNMDPDQKSRAPWQMKMDEHTTVKVFTKYLSQFPIGASVDWVHTRSLPEMGLEEYRAKWKPEVKARVDADVYKFKMDMHKRAPKMYKHPDDEPKSESDYLDRGFYVPSDSAIRKPDNGLPAIFCMGPDNATFNCYVHYFTPESILVQASFSDSQLKFWREITQFTPQYVNSIRVKE